MPRAEWVSQREFAKRVGVSHTMVAKGIKSGRILEGPDGKINWNTQGPRWELNRDPSKERGIADTGTPSGRVKPYERPVAAEVAPGETTNKHHYAAAKTATETFKAKKMQLEYEEMTGKLVSREAVEAAVFTFSRTVRDSVMNLPDRVAAESAAEVITYLRPILTAVTGEKKATEIMESISLPDLSRIMHRLWDREGRYVLEHLDKGADL